VLDGRENRAEEAITDLQADLAEVEAEVGNGTGRTAAVLYPTVGGGTTYAYGTRSMAHPQLEAAGFENVFADVDERVFEVTLEELLGRDPDVLVLLHSEGEPGPVEDAVTRLPGAGELTAVRNGDVMTQLFNFTEPPSPLAFEGLERIVERFGPGS
jgi:iron complex transport system substrate-binding protein